MALMIKTSKTRSSYLLKCNPRTLFSNWCLLNLGKMHHLTLPSHRSVAARWCLAYSIPTFHRKRIDWLVAGKILQSCNTAKRSCLHCGFPDCFPGYSAPSPRLQACRNVVQAHLRATLCPQVDDLFSQLFHHLTFSQGTNKNMLW